MRLQACAFFECTVVRSGRRGCWGGAGVELGEEARARGTFGRWGEVFGDDVVVAAAMIDRLVHHAEVIALSGDSYRLRDRDLGRVPPATTNDA